MRTKKNIFFLLICLSSFINTTLSQQKIVVFQTDFGLKDGAVAAMKGVAMGVDSSLQLFDLTHEIPAYNIWEAAFRLEQTVSYWPKGTVFVSVVDPGVGTNRQSVVLKTKTGHYIVSPDNGTLTLIAASLGIDTIRAIDEVVNRRKNSAQSYTFHGRDVYAYTAARLASGTISFAQVGQILPAQVVQLPFQKATFENPFLKGNIPILDIQYGNVWTNITDSLFKKLHPVIGDVFEVIIVHENKIVYQDAIPYCNTFGAVAKGKPLLYLNSLLQVSLAINMGNFSQKFEVGSGNDWTINIKKLPNR